MLYPAELQALMVTSLSGFAGRQTNEKHGAGDGNRTHATSLEGWSSTIELHPRTTLATEATLHSVNYDST